MRWSERLWRLRECWRKLGTLAGKGAGERLDYACDLIMEAWVDQPPAGREELLAWVRESTGLPKILSGEAPSRAEAGPEDLW